MTTKNDQCLERLPGRHRPPLRQWRPTYLRRRRKIVEEGLACEGLLKALRRGDQLPKGYGYGFDERVIEYAWLLSRDPSGRTLDAGSILNHEHVLSAFSSLLDPLVIFTLAPEEVAYPQLGISYVFGDMRELPFADGWFDTVISLSTLEHIGMNNTHYGGDSESTPDAQEEMKMALREMRRVTKSGGRILISVPFGLRTDMGWSRQLDEEEVRDMVSELAPRDSTISVYAYDEDGWNVSDMKAAGTKAYHDFAKAARWPADKAAAARAVACIDIRL